MDNHDESTVMTDTRQYHVMTGEKLSPIRYQGNHDYIVPDYLPDAKRILAVNAVPHIEGAYSDEGKHEIEGCVEIRILLETDNHKIASLTFSEPFSQVMGGTEHSSVSYTEFLPVIDKNEARLVNPRKINVKYDLVLNGLTYDMVSTTPAFDEEDGIEDQHLYITNTKTLKTAECRSEGEEGVCVDADIELDSAAMPIHHIIMSDLTTGCTSVHYHDGMADIKSDFRFLCIYESDGGSICQFTKTISDTHSFVCQLSENADLWVDVKPYFPDVTVTENSFGERKCLEISFRYDFRIDSAENCDCQLVSDAFSTEYETAASVHELSVISYCQSASCHISVNAAKDRHGFLPDSMTSVLFGYVNLIDCRLVYDCDEKKTVAEGHAEIQAVLSSDKNEEENIDFAGVSFTEPFRCELNGQNLPADVDLRGSFSSDDLRFRLDSGKLYADFEMTVCAHAFHTDSVVCLDSLSVDKQKHIAPRQGGMTLYYPNDHDDLWSVAKHYAVSPDAIAALNHVENDNIARCKVLLIPGSCEKKPVFSTVV